MWNGKANTSDSAMKAAEWSSHRRVHQFSGNDSQTYGGHSINIDRDYLNVKL